MSKYVQLHRLDCAFSTYGQFVTNQRKSFALEDLKMHLVVNCNRDTEQDIIQRVAGEEEDRRLAQMTPEEKLAEKLRMQKIQEESDLRVALETFGVKDVGGSGLDAFNPQTEEEFKEFGATLSWKLSQYKESPHFPQFIDDLVRSICANLPLSELKKLKLNVENMHSEKLKLEKQNAKKPASKSKGKVTLKKENDDIDDYKKYGNDFATTYEDYDDFM